jgi:initiation factor 1A
MGKKLRIKDVHTQIKYPEDEQEIGKILKAQGNCHFTVEIISTGKETTASLSGSLKKRNGRIITNDIVLMESMNDLNSKYQIIFKYTNEQVKILNKENVIKSKIEENKTNEIELMFEGDEEEIKEVELDESFVDNI